MRGNLGSDASGFSAKSASEAIRGSVWIRLGVLLAIGLALILAFAPPDIVSELTLKAAYLFGYYLAPGILVGGIIGWLKFDRRIWLWSTVISILVIDSLVWFVMSQPG